MSPKRSRMLGFALQVLLAGMLVAVDAGDKWLVATLFSRGCHSWMEGLAAAAAMILLFCMGVAGLCGFLYLSRNFGPIRISPLANILLWLCLTGASATLMLLVHPQMPTSGPRYYFSRGLNVTGGMCLILGIWGLLRRPAKPASDDPET